MNLLEPLCQEVASQPVAARKRARRRILVLGYGNPGREDDGLGPAAASAIERIGRRNVTVSNNYQLVPEDVVELATADVAWFIDASKEGLEPFEVRPLSPSLDTSFTSHHMTPETLLALTEQYYGRTPEAYLMAIRGYNFEFFERLTSRASDNLRQALTLLLSMIDDGEEVVS